MNHEDFYIRWGVSQILGEFGESSALQVLSEGLTHENHRVRTISARLLGNLASEGVVPLLLRAINDSTYSVRRNAAISLAAFLREEAIPELFKALRNYYPENSEISDLEVVFYPVENYPVVIKGFDERHC
ncbi:MAG: HEAT repeat domain-containing protein [Alkalinema sp. RU_4_3]|nr:HEAT repeat domain-containing protein [Alkalinema sp. RU_4_3]